MPYPMHVLVNDFALRSFRETADKDYITARMACRARLIQSYRWSALHCLEKYVKGILLLNRVDTQKLGHTVLPGIDRMKERGKFELELTPGTLKFIKNLEESGADDRYYLLSYDIEPLDIAQFDRAVWELRMYCRPLDYDIDGEDGKSENMLARELDAIRVARENYKKGSLIHAGVLEKILEKKDHPAREALIWNNLFFGTSRRKSVKMRLDWEAGNSAFFLNPQIIDEVVKYVMVPKELAEGVRQLAKQRANEKAKAERDAKKAAKLAAKQSGGSA